MATTKQGIKGKESVEDQDVLIDKLKDPQLFFEKNKKLITYVGGGLLVVILAIVGYKYWVNSNNEEAQAAMVESVFAWEKDSLKLALNGDQKEIAGLTEIADNYSGTDAGNLASYYAGVALMKQGDIDGAIEKLEDFKSKDLVVQGLAYSLLGDAYLEKKDYDNAREYYSKASKYKPNEGFTPQYLMKLALSAELQNDYAAAIEAYDKIITNYPNSRVVTDAKKYKARAEGLNLNDNK
jgi:TolA-binding protein